MNKGWSVSIALAAALIVGAAAPAQAVLAPANLSAHTMSSSAIALNWTSTDTDGGLAASTPYYYRMRSVSGSKLSTRTAVIGATTMPPAPVATVTRTPLPTTTPTATITATPIRTVTATRTATTIPTTTATA